MRRSLPARIAIYVVLVAAALAMVLPFWWTLTTSFKLPGDVFSGNPIPDPFTLAELPGRVPAAAVPDVLPQQRDRLRPRSSA